MDVGDWEGEANSIGGDGAGGTCTCGRKLVIALLLNHLYQPCKLPCTRYNIVH